MIKFLLSVLFFATSLNLSCQNLRIGNNFIIVVNNKVVSGSIANVRLILEDINNNKVNLKLRYIPGELSFDTVTESVMFNSDSIKAITLAFDNYEYLNGKQILHNYEIKLNNKWLEYSFIILRIFDDRNSKKIKYSFSFEFPGYSIVPLKRNNG